MPDDVATPAVRPGWPTWRPSLRLSVACLALAIVVGMALAVSELVAGKLRHTAAAGALHNAEAIVRGYVDPALDAQTLLLGTAPDSRITEELRRLTASGDIRRINIWSRDGRIVYSSEPTLRGGRYSIDSSLATAFLGTSTIAYGGGLAGDGGVGLPDRFLEIYVPIRGSVDGSPIGVYEVYQDARPIEDEIGAAGRDVFLVALVASSVLLALLLVAFAGASRLLARQNRLLREQAATEQLLAADLRRSERRFRALVRNSTDVILIVEANGLIAYESPAITPVLGYDVDGRVGRSMFDVIHPDDVSWIRGLLGDIGRTPGAEDTAEYRVSHADGSWRWVQATAKNLLTEPAVRGIVVNYRDVTERRSLEDQLRHQAFHDGLTGLPNRALLKDRLGHALARARRDVRPMAVLFLDLDDFKAVNDSLGHAAGDDLLVGVADRLRGALRDGDTAARMGGDEFAIVLEDLDAEDVPAGVGRRILDRLRAPFAIQDQEVRIHGSIGIAQHTREDQSADELLRNADVAMYAAKAAGKDRLVVFEADLHDATIGRHQLKADLYVAIERGEFVLEYQPIIDLRSGKTSGVEALVRWLHPRRGLVQPVDFIPLAEESGLIVPLGRWVLEEACRQARAWQQLPGAEDLSVSVNLSGRQVEDAGLVEDVQRAVVASGLEPSMLTLEITESVLMRDVAVATATLRALKGLGVRLAIDDFGTGYSSLASLREFPVDVLKIDRSFVATLHTSDAERALVQSIVSLGGTLRLETVAEGIEQRGQVEELLSFGTRLGQGYFFARPLPPAEVGELLARQGPVGVHVNPAEQPTADQGGRSGGSPHASRRPNRSPANPSVHEVRP